MGISYFELERLEAYRVVNAINDLIDHNNRSNEDKNKTQRIEAGDDDWF